MKYLSIHPVDRSEHATLAAEHGLYEVLSDYCSDNTHIIEAGPGRGPWTPILFEHIAHQKGFRMHWAGVELDTFEQRKSNEYSAGVVFSTDIRDLNVVAKADMALSVRPRDYSIHDADQKQADKRQAESINRQHRRLLSFLKTGGYLIILIHKTENRLVEPFWKGTSPEFAFVKSVASGNNNILVIRKG